MLPLESIHKVGYGLSICVQAYKKPQKYHLIADTLALSPVKPLPAWIWEDIFLPKKVWVENQHTLFPPNRVTIGGFRDQCNQSAGHKITRWWRSARTKLPRNFRRERSD